MANISTTVDLVINKLSQAKFEQLCASNQLDPYQLYMTDYDSAKALSNDIVSLCASLSDYYIKSETSSSIEISNALSAKADAASIPTDLSSFSNSPGYLAKSMFASIQNPKYTVNSIADTLISVLNILRETS